MNVAAIFMPKLARLEVVEEIVDAIRAGAALKAIGCEKPLARNMAEPRRIIVLAWSVNLQNVYFENQTHMNAIQASRRQLSSVMASRGPLVLVRVRRAAPGLVLGRGRAAAFSTGRFRVAEVGAA